MSRFLLPTIALLSLVAPAVHAQDASSIPAGYFDELTYRHVGPVGNRVSAVIGVHCTPPSTDLKTPDNSQRVAAPGRDWR